jgi:16S rRNA (uracil1498-N3)-methyltransferase
MQEPPPTWPLTLIQAIAKGDRDELAIQAATEIGIATIVPWQADRSISRWDGKEAKGVERWQSIVDEASKQSLRSWFPSVSKPLNTQELSNLVAHQANEGTRFLVLDPTAEIGLGSILKDVAKLEKPITVIVGPEGGITENELKSLESAGAVRVHLGKGILRTSTAGVAALAALTAGSGAWG